MRASNDIAKKKRDCFQRITKDLDFSYQEQFMRKAGLSENDIVSTKRKTRGDLRTETDRMLYEWSSQCGRFNENQDDFLSRLVTEVTKNKRDPKNDDFLSNLRNRKLAEQRKLAYFLYDVIKSYDSSDSWDRVEREKLNIEEHVRDENDRNFGDNITEVKYKNLLWWIKMHNIRDVHELAREWHGRDIIIPEQYLSGVEEEVVHQLVAHPSSENELTSGEDEPQSNGELQLVQSPEDALGELDLT